MTMAHVARVRVATLEYLSAQPGPVWVASPDQAALFESSREALRLPSALRAFALPAASPRLA